MKKCYFLSIAAIAALIWTGCSSDIADSSGSKNGQTAIGFKSFVEKNTKASTTPSGSLTQNFWVYAYYDAVGDNPSTNLVPDFMFDQQVNYGVNGFSYTPIKYWPETGDVNFYAFTPNTSAHLTVTNPVSATSTGYPVLSYTIDNSVISQEDLLVSSAEDQDGLSGSVNFAFDHALTKVGFCARTAGNYITQGATVKIKSLNFSGIAKSGSFSFDKYVNVSDNTQWWNVNADTTSYSPALSANGVTVPYFVTDTFMVVNPSNQFLLMIPQSFTGSNANLNIGYEVSYTDGSATKQFSKDIPLSTTLAWLPGMYINYAITISLQTVTFDANVTDWSDVFQNITILPEEDE